MVTSRSASCSDVSEIKRKFKLPSVKLKKLSGDLMDWLGFWAQFAKINEEPSPHASDKFY